MKSLAFCILLLTSLGSAAQENIGMATGNFAGISGVWFNPANIVDSRYKFDFNVVGLNSYYHNNYLQLKIGTLARRQFNKAPYNNNYQAFKDELTREEWPVNGNVKARLSTNVMLPFSFMANINKKSAFALTLNNRTLQTVDNLNPEAARQFYNALRFTDGYNRPIKIEDMKYDFLNWQEVGLTYGHTIVSGKHHYLKAAFTAKWLGATAGAYIATDRATLSFRDSVTMSLSSSRINYARTKNADINDFTLQNLFTNIEDQTIGADVGLVYEFRPFGKKFRFLDPSGKEQTRDDRNKYFIRLGVSVVDLGKFQMKRRPLTNDHSANFSNWNFSQVKANGFNDFDTAYTKQINYLPGNQDFFSFQLPTALIANLDVHLVGPLYINGAFKQPLEEIGKTATARLRSNKWIAITPRLETRFFGLYMPVIRTNEKTYVGATIKIGPLFVGSNNLSELLSNSFSQEADLHAGFRLSFGRGKPNRLLASALQAANGDGTFQTRNQAQLDSLKYRVRILEIKDSLAKAQPKIIVNNYGVASGVDVYNDSVVLSNRQAAGYSQTTEKIAQDSVIERLSYDLAASQVELNRLKKSQETAVVATSAAPAADSVKATTTGGEKLSKKEKRKAEQKKKKEKGKSETNPTTKTRSQETSSNNQQVTVENNNDEVVKELERIRKQNAVQNAAIIAGSTATVVAVASSDNKNDNKSDKNSNNAAVATVNSDSVMAAYKDSLLRTMPQKRDTIYIRDTVRIVEQGPTKAESSSITPPLQDRGQVSKTTIYFASGSSIISAADAKRLQTLAASGPNSVVITSFTDVTGAAAANAALAEKRLAAVTTLLEQAGVAAGSIQGKTQAAGGQSKKANPKNRRIEVESISH
jgi:outer membrane protein OmpA-like peptidoglycan-associated protein